MLYKRHETCSPLRTTTLTLFRQVQPYSWRSWQFLVRSPDNCYNNGWGPNAAYYAVADLIQSQGFRQVTYVVEHDRFMKPVSFECSSYPPGGPETTKTTPRDPQPSTWDAMIKQRDGVDSGARVRMFRLLDDGKHRIHLETEFETVEKVDRGAGERVGGQIEIEIDRGKDADYVEDGKFSEYDRILQNHFHDLSWKGILGKAYWVDTENDPTAHL